MLRHLLRPRGGILSLGLGARINTARPRSLHSQPEVVRLQQVKFVKRRRKISNLLIFAGVSYALYEALIRALVILVDEEDLELTEEERQQLEEEAAEPMFIPFPGFTQTVDPLPYRSTDPEWRAFVQVSQNGPLLMSIRGSLAETARRAIAKHPVLSRHTGSNLVITKYWLDIHYPLRPPPTFLRQGLAFGPDGITWTKQPVDSVAVFRTRQALWPSAIASSVWSFTRALATQNAMAVAKFLGYETQTDASVSLQQLMERMQQLKGQPGKPAAVPPPPLGQMGGGPTAGPLSPAEERASGSTRTPETMGTAAGMGNAPPPIPKAKDLYLIRTTREHTTGPWDSFKKNLSRTWRKAPAYPPRGSIRVSGLVEIESPGSIMTVDCVAWWDPQTQKFDPTTMFLSMRTMRPKIQSALR